MQGLTGKGDALFLCLLRFHHLYRESGVGYYAGGLCFGGITGENLVEYLCRFFRSVASVEIFLLATAETETFGGIDFLIIGGDYLKVGGKGDFIVPVQAVHDCKPCSVFLKGVAVQAQ